MAAGLAPPPGPPGGRHPAGDRPGATSASRWLGNGHTLKRGVGPIPADCGSADRRATMHRLMDCFLPVGSRAPGSLCVARCGMDGPGIDWSDAEAVAACVQAHAPGLLAFVERRMSPGLRQRLDPDDILQEVCLAAVRPPGGAAVLPHREPFGWLCHVATQRIIDAHRRYFEAAKRDGRREVSIDAPGRSAEGGPHADPDAARGLASMLAVSMTTPSRAMSRDAKEYRLRSLIEALPEEPRQVIRLRYVDGLPTREIAERLGKSDVAVRVMLSRTLQKLQMSFADASGG